MKSLPTDVVKVGKCLFPNPSHDLYKIAKKLINEKSPELVTMWRSLERQNPFKKDIREKTIEDTMWIWIFLRASAEASKLPSYHYLSRKKRKELSNRITNLANELGWELTNNQLDVQLVFTKGGHFNGFYFYEDFGESNQQLIDEDPIQKWKVSELLQRVSKRAVEKITDEPKRGKAGTNVHAIHFIRIMSDHNKFMYLKPLHAVTAIAANAIFGTSYQVWDISKLLNR